jgi:hypothetical protein
LSTNSLTRRAGHLILGTGIPRDEEAGVPQTRISTWGHKTLRKLAKEYGMTSEQVLDKAIDILERERMLEEIDDGYAALRADPKAWAEELAERALWETAIADGLEGLD